VNVERGVRVIPSNDSAFRQHVERLTARHVFREPDELAARLRTLFPRVVVRASEVSDHADVWYVYRDGVWQSSADPRWWTDARTPLVLVTIDGWIEEANAPARAILGLSSSDPMPRFFTDFVVPGTLDDATDLFAVVAAGHELSATTLVRPTNGDVIACDLRAWSVDGWIHGAFRLADDIPSRPATSPTVVAPLTCEPAADALFARYAEEALARMPEPTAEGLALRLRRLYPHARVVPGDGRWAVFRDAPGTAASADEWWRSEGLPAVRYDRQGLIIEANDAAQAVLGPGLVGHHWQELVTVGTTDQVDAVLRLIEEVGWALSRFRMPGPDGYLFEFDSYTEVSEGAFRTLLRPRQIQTR
jgi:PAS domain-containing protein